MKLILLLTFLAIVPAAKSQTKIDGYYLTAEGDTIKVGDTVRIGPGSKPEGGYKYIDGFFTPGVGMVGQRMTVKAILRKGNQKSGYSYFLKLYPGVGVMNYQAALDHAITTGELELKPDFSNTGKVIKDQ